MTTIKNSRSKSFVILLLGGTFFMSQLPVFGQAGQLDVSAQANIYGAGHASPPNPGGPGAGTLPPSFVVTGGNILTFQVSGLVSPNGGGNFDGPDGLLGASTQMSSYGGISGIQVKSHMFLAGVFLGDKEPTGASPATLDLSNGDFAELSPSLNQMFFIGDGSTGNGTGNLQKFHVPVGATRLFLGFVDGFDFTGLPGFYTDNLGSVHVVYTLAKVGPEIVRQPQSIDVKLGATATFFVQVSGPKSSPKGRGKENSAGRCQEGVFRKVRPSIFLG